MHTALAPGSALPPPQRLFGHSLPSRAHTHTSTHRHTQTRRHHTLRPSLSSRSLYAPAPLTEQGERMNGSPPPPALLRPDCGWLVYTNIDAGAHAHTLTHAHTEADWLDDGQTDRHTDGRSREADNECDFRHRYSWIRLEKGENRNEIRFCICFIHTNSTTNQQVRSLIEKLNQSCSCHNNLRYNNQASRRTITWL